MQILEGSTAKVILHPFIRICLNSIYMYPWILFINLFLRNAQRKYTSISESIDLYANLSQIGSELLIRYSKIVNVSS